MRLLVGADISEMRQEEGELRRKYGMWNVQLHDFATTIVDPLTAIIKCQFIHPVYADMVRCTLWFCPTASSLCCSQSSPIAYKAGHSDNFSAPVGAVAP